MKRVAYYVQGIWLQNLIWSFMPLTATLIIISFSSPTLSFIPDLKPSFSANPSHCSLSFSSCVIPCGMWVPVAVWQPCELLYTCYLLNYNDAKQLDEKSLNVPCIWHCTNDEILHETAVNLAVFSWLPPDRADIPAFTPSRSWHSIKRPRRDARLSWPSWLVTYRDGIPARRRSPIQVLTGPDVRPRVGSGGVVE